MSNKEIVEKWYADLDAKNFDALRESMDDNHLFINPMTPEPIGADEHIGMMQQMHSAFSGTHTINLSVEEGDHVAISGSWSGKHVGEFNGIPATRNDVNFTYSDFFHIVNGKVAKEHMELNPLAINMQIGAAAPQEA